MPPTPTAVSTDGLELQLKHELNRGGEPLPLHALAVHSAPEPLPLASISANHPPTDSYAGGKAQAPAEYGQCAKSKGYNVSSAKVL